MINFEDFLYDYLELANPAGLKYSFDEFAKHQEMSLEADLTTEDYKTIILKYTDPENRENVREVIDFDKHLYSQAEYYFKNYPVRITPEISDIGQLNKYLNMLRTAVNLIKSHQEFYSEYPYYKGAIVKLGKTLDEIKQVFYRPLKIKRGTRGDKTEMGYKLEPYLHIIENAESHQDAVNKLKDEIPDFEWDDHNKELFQTDGETLVKIRAARALRHIAVIKWDDNAPSLETIRTVLRLK